METKDYIVITDETGSANISEDVVAVIAGAAALETDGVAALAAGGSKDVMKLVARKSLGRSVKTEIGDGGVAIEIAIIAQRGSAVSNVGESVQRAVSDALSDACGIKPERVDVKIAGIRPH